MKPIVYTNKGPIRDHNEDVVFVAGNIISGCSLTAPFEVNAENSKGCCVVIDGMGGYEGGYEDPGDNGGGGSSGPGFLSSILRTAAGVALGNKLTENKKRNYMDSPNCERAKTGRKSSCWGCGLGDYCTMHDKY